MTDKEKRELKDGVVSIFKRFNILDNTSTIGNMRDDILRYIDSIQEEPVSEDWYEAAVEHAATGEILPNGKEMINFDKVKAFKAGTNWQKQQMMKGAIDAKVGFRFHRLSIDLKDNGIEGLENGDKVKILMLKQEDN